MTHYFKRAGTSFGALLLIMSAAPLVSASDASDMAKLDGASSVSCTGCDFSGENLTQFPIFSEAELSSANLSGSTLDGMNLGGAALKGADLSGAHLVRTNLSNATLDLVDFSNADLQKANLQGASLSGASWNGADLSAANLTGVTGFNGAGSGAKLCQTTMPDGSNNDSGC